MIDWHNPDYDPIWAERAKRLARLREKSELVPALKQHYKNNPVQFIVDWGVTVDPRNAELGLKTTVPFLLFPKQVEFIEWVVARWKGREDGLAEKSRDMGVSWLCVAAAAWLWLFHPGVVVGFGSRKEEYVDKLGDPKSLFWKVRVFISYVPDEFLPLGYNEKKHAPYMNIVNPETGSVIVGEAGDNIGRGARTSIYFKDEAQPLDSKIITPDGCDVMGNMAVGRFVIGVDGLPKRIIAVNDCGVHPVFRIGFTDGTYTECSYNHLWTVEKKWGRRETLTLRAHEIVDNFVNLSPKGQTHYKYKIPLCSPIEFTKASEELPLDPYIIGALLGDGCVSNKKSSSELTTADDEIVNQFEQLLPDGVIIKKTKAKYSYRIIGKAQQHGVNNIFKTKLIDSGIYGMTSCDKEIPDKYLYSSVKNRLALLQGLMDTDGSASGTQTTYHTISSKLADQVRFLVQSLGGMSSLQVKPDHRGFKTVYVLTVIVSNNLPLFRLSRKLDSTRVRSNSISKTINHAEYVGHKLVRCISVDSDDGLYLTDNCIVTHNSAFYERPETIDAALSQTSNCKLDVSTPNGNGNPFYRKRHAGKIPVFTFHWRDDPRKNDVWYKRQCDTLDPVVIAQEIEIDYNASTTDSWLDGSLIEAAQNRRPAEIIVNGPWVIGVDAAHMGDDESVITKRPGSLTLPQVYARKIDGPELAGRVEEECRTLEGAGGLIGAIIIELDGPGVSCYDVLKRGKYADVVYGVHTGARVQDDRNYNIKSQMWRYAREYLEVGGNVMPVDPELKIQLASVKYKYKDGLLLMEAKKEHKAVLGKSPDRADSWVLTFATPPKQKKKPTPILPTYSPSVPGMGY